MRLRRKLILVSSASSLIVAASTGVASANTSIPGPGGCLGSGTHSSPNKTATAYRLSCASAQARLQQFNSGTGQYHWVYGIAGSTSTAYGDNGDIVTANQGQMYNVGSYGSWTNC